MKGLNAVVEDIDSTKNKLSRELNERVYSAVRELDTKNEIVTPEFIDTLQALGEGLVPDAKPNEIRTHIVGVILEKFGTIPWGLIEGKELPKA